jgi:NAD(P)-dependent dehydrogenase (short-subunit alcohol dehydrogenase family)
VEDFVKSNNLSRLLPSEQMFRLDERVALVTGATGHLGKSLVAALCEAGAHVILNGRDEGEVYSLGVQLEQKGFKITPFVSDLTDDELLEEGICTILNDTKRLDIIVNNAYSGSVGTLDMVSIRDFEQAYQICVVVPFRILQITRPFLKVASTKNLGGASIINIGSMYGSVSPDPSLYGDSQANNPIHYGSAKAALLQMTRYLACHLAHDKIRVNCISPGPFPNSNISETNPEFWKKIC